MAWLRETLGERRAALADFLATSPDDEPDGLVAARADLSRTLDCARDTPAPAAGAALDRPTLAAEREISLAWERYLIASETIAYQGADAAADRVTVSHNRVAVAAALVRHTVPRYAAAADLCAAPPRPWQTLRASRPTRTPEA